MTIKEMLIKYQMDSRYAVPMTEHTIDLILNPRERTYPRGIYRVDDTRDSHDMSSDCGDFLLLYLDDELFFFVDADSEMKSTFAIEENKVEFNENFKTVSPNRLADMSADYYHIRRTQM